MAFDREFVGATVFCEASNRSGAARRGVAHAIVNRRKLQTWFGKTDAEVVLRYHQFSEWNGDPADNRNLLRVADASDNDLILMDSLDAYEEAVAGYPDPTDGATHFHDDSIAPPAWTVGAVKTCQIDSLIFYKGVK